MFINSTIAKIRLQKKKKRKKKEVKGEMKGNTGKPEAK